MVSIQSKTFYFCVNSILPANFDMLLLTGMPAGLRDTVDDGVNNFYLQPAVFLKIFSIFFFSFLSFPFFYLQPVANLAIGWRLGLVRDLASNGDEARLALASGREVLAFDLVVSASGWARHDLTRSGEVVACPWSPGLDPHQPSARPPSWPSGEVEWLSLVGHGRGPISPDSARSCLT